MTQKDARKRALQILLKANSALLNDSDDGIRAMEEWICSHAKPSATDPERPDDIWFSVGLDAALWIGDTAIKRAPHLHWVMGGGTKNDATFQHYVIAGFRNASKSYVQDVDAAAVAYIWAVTVKGEEFQDEFVRLLKIMARLA